MTSHLMHGAYSILSVMVGIRIHVIHCLVVTPSLQQHEEPHEGGAITPSPTYQTLYETASAQNVLGLPPHLLLGFHFVYFRLNVIYCYLQNLV